MAKVMLCWRQEEVLSSRGFRQGRIGQIDHLIGR